MRDLATGRLTQAVTSIATLHDQGRRLGFRGADAMRVFQRFLLLRELGRCAELVADAEHLARRRWDAGHGLPIVAAAAADVGDTTLAARALRTFMADTFADLPDHLGLPAVLATLTHACCIVGDVDVAERLYERLCPYEGQALVVAGAAHLGAASRLLGELALTAGDRGLAVRHLDEALALDGRSGARLWAAHAAARLAELRAGSGASNRLPRWVADVAEESGSARLQRRMHASLDPT